MQQLQDIFTKVWPSVMALAEDLGEEYDTALRWRLRGRIPQEHWTQVIKKAAERGHVITAEQLLTLATPMKKRGRPAAQKSKRK